MSGLAVNSYQTVSLDQVRRRHQTLTRQRYCHLRDTTLVLLSTCQFCASTRRRCLTSWSAFGNFDKIGAPAYHTTPVPSEVNAFVKAIMDKCATHRPAWITVPQIPSVNDSGRNKINRTFAAAAGRWKSSSGFSGKLILPI